MFFGLAVTGSPSSQKIIVSGQSLDSQRLDFYTMHELVVKKSHLFLRLESSRLIQRHEFEVGVAVGVRVSAGEGVGVAVGVAVGVGVGVAVGVAVGVVVGVAVGVAVGVTHRSSSGSSSGDETARSV